VLARGGGGHWAAANEVSEDCLTLFVSSQVRLLVREETNVNKQIKRVYNGNRAVSQSVARR